MAPSPSAIRPTAAVVVLGAVLLVVALADLAGAPVPTAPSTPWYEPRVR